MTRASVLALGLVTALSVQAVANDGRTEWQFTALLDGDVVGTHDFVVEPAGPPSTERRTLTSRARFTVKVLGIALYRYRHEVRERWHDGCLESIAARTDDNGTVTEVDGRLRGDRFDVVVRDPADASQRSSADGGRGCVWSFAYWNPALARQQRLLDPGTGRMTPVEIQSLPDRSIEVAGRRVQARGIRIIGSANPIDVWYHDERWVGLDTTVGGGRTLSYRMR
ncbi:MAG: DUF6134 family protein [Burkholderiaceae bacterium]